MSLQRVIQLSALLIGCALLPVTSHAQLSFESHPVAPAGTVTVHGDFNNDGREDLVVGNQLYLSTGDGIYQAPITLPASIAAIGDFNHDGKLDFVSYVPASTSVVVFLGVCCAVDWITWKFTGAKHCLRNKNARERARFGGSRLSVHALGPLMDK